MNILSVKANGTLPCQYEKVGVGEAQELGFASRRLQGPVAIDGSLLGNAGKWGACG